MKLLQERIKPIVLSVAGLDPCGGAGIYSDVNIFSSHALRGMAVPTVITIQNDGSFKKLKNVDQDFFVEALRYMFESYTMSGLKIGLITEKYHVDAVVDCIKEFKPAVTVLDPIISSSSGFNFWDKSMLSYVAKKLLPCVDVITPNYLEAVAILNTVGEDTATLDQKELAKKLNMIFRTKVVVTGGDSVANGKVTDVFYDGINLETRSAEYFDLPREFKHGTGCAFSASLISHMCKGLDFAAAGALAALFVENKLRGTLQ